MLDLKRVARSIVLALTLGWAAVALAQTTGTPIETPPVPLPPEKQALVKEHVKRSNVPATNLGTPVSVGTTLPETVALFALPQDAVTEVPQVTSYKFLVTGDTIAVIDPGSRKVIQLIQR